MDDAHTTTGRERGREEAREGGREGGREGDMALTAEAGRVYTALAHRLKQRALTALTAPLL